MILITGATGLLGSRLLYDLVSAGQRVRAMKRPSSRMICTDRYFEGSALNHPLIEWVDADLDDIFSVESALEGITDVYHCAAKVSFQPGDREMMQRTNASGTANLVNLCLEKNIRKFCHVSSVAAIGRTGDGIIRNEESDWKTSGHNSFYAVSKYSAEREVWRGIAEGLSAVIVNPGLIIGPGNWKTDSSMIIRKVWKGLSFYTDGVNGLIDVADASKSMISLMNSDIHSERFILVAENFPLREMVNIIADTLGKKRPVIHAGPFLTSLAWRAEYLRSLFNNSKPVITRETAASAQHKSYYSNEKIRKATGIEFSDIKESLKKTSEIFLREHTR